MRGLSVLPLRRKALSAVAELGRARGGEMCPTSSSREEGAVHGVGEGGWGTCERRGGYKCGRYFVSNRRSARDLIPGAKVHSLRLDRPAIRISCTKAMGLILKNSLVYGTCTHFSLIMGIHPRPRLPPARESLYSLPAEKSLAGSHCCTLSNASLDPPLARCRGCSGQCVGPRTDEDDEDQAVGQGLCHYRERPVHS